MQWVTTYAEKVVSASEAVSKIKSGNRVVIGSATSAPEYLIKAMIANKEQYENVEISNLVPLGKCEYAWEGMEKYFKYNGLFLSAGTREVVNSGRGDFTPAYFHEVPKYYIEYLPVDVCLVQVSKADQHGYFSLGGSVDYTKPAVDAAKLVIVQVNKYVPRTHGDSFIHVSDVDYIVEYDEPMPEYKSGAITEVEEAIGKNIASLIEDGDTLQLGIGTIPDATLTFMKGYKNLGLHSEMISDGVVDLIKQGVINNKVKSINRGKSLITFFMGTQKLYDFVNDNPGIEMRPVSYVNNPYIISQNDHMTAINSCLQVDMVGQVVSESIGTKQYSGVGGQVDYMRGANMSKGGKAIIAMPSTASKGKISRIVSVLDQGAIVTTNRNDVNYVVTEYGIAKLKGKTIRDRAKALIEIAHPDFRAQLEEEFYNRYKSSSKDINL